MDTSETRAPLRFRVATRHVGSPSPDLSCFRLPTPPPIIPAKSFPSFLLPFSSSSAWHLPRLIVIVNAFLPFLPGWRHGSLIESLTAVTAGVACRRNTPPTFP